MELQQIGLLEDYLRQSEYINYSEERVQAVIKKLETENDSELTRIESAFEFVRDQIRHSYDIQAREVTRTASEVSEFGHGICYAKSHLLAALLRGMGVPAGICYQRLTLYDEPEDGYCIHALNTVYLREYSRWIRLDARGNKEGVDAQFSIDEEKLAFPIRQEYGEIDYTTNFTEPHPAITRVLNDHQDCMVMYRSGLPEHLEDYDKAADRILTH